MKPNFDLTGRLALVTGSSRGLGWAMAQALAASGARLLLHGRDHAALAARAATLAERGTPAAEILYFDVADGPAVQDAFAEITEAHGRLDILVGNAGGIIRKPVLEFSDADWHQVLETDLSSCFRCAREALRLMIPQGHGRIILTSSIMGDRARPTIPAYVAAKAGLHGLVRALAVEVATAGVTVNAIAPGYFPTDATGPVQDDPVLNQWVIDATPMHRWGDPAELGGAVVFLASDAASFVTGSVLTVDGGASAAL
ncbi:Gluconate 5-dehydrogenase [Rhodovastum atsumiense]|uniref:SDR family oxidoreductase n=1 Tax=Rhodovastum atsumiense TaxID=504468 RepID=A0A5M6IKP5_9PROT|nr:SDR family oxidoreductase [Rhodovastum atsumiense]KAA5608449.1 SDR family oxidoreductase [Rhodovastum atsumiense]CAH2604647.1 Gluconate 5-dehydrogenase [Rhodovastum atsumiense]